MSVGRVGRWALPVAVVVGIAGASAAPGAFAASAHPALAKRTPQQLLAAIAASPVTAMSGTVRTTADLGLPQLPTAAGYGGAGLTALLAGKHTLRVSVDGPTRARVAVLGDLVETDVVRDGRDVWTWTSATNTVVHRTLPAATAGSGDAADAGTTAEQQLTPQAAARRMLAAVDPSTVVTVDRTARVARRPAYQIVLTPKTRATLVGSVRIAVDASTFVPLRVQVWAAGSTKPAWQTQFTSVSFARPAAGTFRFTPPRGATVDDAPATSAGAGADRPAEPATRASTTGTGWATVLALPAGTASAATDAASGASTGTSRGRHERAGGVGVAGLLDRLTTPVAQGRLLTTRLLSVLVTPDGRVYVGAVPPAAVERAASAG